MTLLFHAGRQLREVGDPGRSAVLSAHTKSFMNTQPTTKTKRCRSGTAIGVSISIGAAIGAAFGAATDNMAASVAWGVALGAAVGAILTFTKTKCD